MPVLVFQLVIIGSIVLAGLHSHRAVTTIAIAWSIFTLIMVFMPWLMILQLTIIWGTRHLCTRGDGR